MPQPCVRCGYAVSTILSIDISQNEVFDGVADISTVLVGTKGIKVESINAVGYVEIL